MNNAEAKDPRDTQFKGVAKLTVEEIINEVPATIYPLEIDISDKLEKLLARRFYDFAVYVMGIPQSASAIEEMVSFVPDLTEWPSNP